MTPTPVIFSAPKQRYLVDRLLRHCRSLDGMEVKVFDAPEPDLPYPDICNWSFHFVCQRMEGKAFFWLEADAIPLVPGWLQAIAKEWEIAQSFNREILWSSDTNPPYDLCCGVGVYGPGILKHLPDPVKTIGFDGFIHQNLSHLVHKTPLIQHSYGQYGLDGKVSLWRHPQPRDGAVIFHKEQYLDLITNRQTP
jgi:hypothetical protein